MDSTLIEKLGKHPVDLGRFVKSNNMNINDDPYIMCIYNSFIQIGYSRRDTISIRYSKQTTR